MFLKSLTLKGFKSFADVTTLEFEPGVTVVVGPNGSGKSNVVDAVAWVLGAQGPRTVRSAKMDDVIFAGTPKRPALGRAEVSLTIDNTAGLLPVDFSEVTLTRTLFRSGESEYAINRVPCRLLDLQEMLSDTGVGRQQHVIVSQGQLDAVLNQRPDERRLVIEEAAGVLKYRRRKEKSERRLESTEASLVRLQDLLREVRRQLRPLEKQAEAARRHGDLVAGLQAVRRYLAGQELQAVEVRLAAAARRRAELGRAAEVLREALARFDADVLRAEAEMEAARAGRDEVDLGELMSRAEGLRAQTLGLLALLGERRRSLGRDLSATVDHDVVASLEAESASLAAQLADTAREAEGLVPVEAELARAEADLAEETARFEAERHRDRPVRSDPAAEVRGELGVLRRAFERAANELRGVEARVGSLDQRCGRLRAEAGRLRLVVAGADEAAAALDEAARAAQVRSGEAVAAELAADEGRRQADAEQHRWAARHEALAQALSHARARAGAERLAGVVGVVGTLLELVEVDDGWEAAFEAAAGEALAAVIVDGGDSARRGLEELHRAAVGGAVLALPELAVPDRGLQGLPIQPGRCSLRPHVRAGLPAVGLLLDRLLAVAVVVDGTWSDALDVAEEHPELVVVSRRGDRFAGGVWRAGSGEAAVTGGALEEAGARAESATGSAHAAAAAAWAAQKAAVEARRVAAEAVRAAETNVGRRVAAAEGLARLGHELGEAEADLRAAVAQRDELQRRLEREQQRLDELEGLLPELEAAVAAQADQALAERAARSRLADRSAAVAALRRDLEVRAAGLEERRVILGRRHAEIEARLKRNVAEREEAADRRQRLEAHARVAARLVVLVESRQAEVDRLLEAVRTARRDELAAGRDRTDRLEALRRQRAAAERQLGEVRERAGRAELEDGEARVRLEALTEAVRRELDCEPEATRGAALPALPPGTSPTSRRSELERELRLMGPVNPLALEEHTALQERHQFLEAQLEDVRAARRELAKVIRAIDAQMVEVLRAAWLDVAENFERLFATLFPGGQGRLRLTDPDHLLETGIEVEARPSGKNVRRLSLLSGGERSLVAMAFLFAIFRSRPSPFYLMDEVEAALDDVNLHRFLDLLHEFRSEAQLVVVSHQKRTMEAADCLYGVTMSPGGSSRVVSERISVPAEDPHQHLGSPR